MDKYNHFAYGELIATKHKDIAHTESKKQYFKATELEELEDLNARLTNASGTILIAIDGTNSDFGYKESDSLMERPQYFFIVATQTSSQDTTAVFASQQKCKEIAKQIIAKMMNDAVKRTALQYLEPDSFTMRGIGPIGVNFYGVILGFTFECGLNYQLDPSKWEV